MNISSGYNTPFIAVARSRSYERIDGGLTIYDQETGHQTPEFPIRFDFGGNRLAMSRDRHSCFVGCYKKYGLAAYSTLNGSELWRRNDLKGVQEVSMFPFDDAMFCGRVGGSEILCTRTGNTLEEMLGVNSVYPSPFSKVMLASKDDLELHSEFGTRVGSIKRGTFAELDCCFSENELLITESGGVVRCFDLVSLKPLWKHRPPAGSHFLRVSYCQPLGYFIGIQWRYVDSAEPVKRIVHFERHTGRVLNEVALGTSMNHEFCLAGTAVFTSDLRLICVETGKVIREFTQPTNDSGELEQIRAQTH